jgi:hypothetical protein
MFAGRYDPLEYVKHEHIELTTNVHAEVLVAVLL